MCGPFLRAGKVSIEEILEACVHKSLIMRTRPRLSDKVAKWGLVHSTACTRNRSHASAPTTERLCREVRGSAKHEAST